MWVDMKMKRSVTAVLLVMCISVTVLDIAIRIQKGYQVLWTGDMYAQTIPFLTFAKQSILSGQLPLWNPYQACGRPFFASIEIGLLYPINWIIFLFDIRTALLIIQIVNIAIGAAGMVVFLRYLELKWPAIVFSSCFFAHILIGEELLYLCGGATLSLLPIIFWLFYRIRRLPNLTNSALLALTLSLCFLSGHLQYFYYTCLALFFSFLFMETVYKSGAFIKRSIFIALAFLLMSLMVSIQFFPSLELFSESVRAQTTGAQPTLFSIKYNFFEAYMVLFDIYKFKSYYFGSALFLVPFSLLSKKLRPYVLGLFAALFATILVYLSAEIPVLSLLGKILFADIFRTHIRIFNILLFLVAVLAGIGLSSFWEMKPRRLNDTQTEMETWPRIVVITNFAILVFVASFYTYKGVYLPAFEFYPRILLIAALIGMIALMYAHKLSSSSKSIGLWIMALLVLCDITYRDHIPKQRHAANLNEVYAIFDPGVRWIKENAGYNRALIISPFPRLNENAGTRFGFLNINSYTSLTLDRWKNFVQFTTGIDAERLNRMSLGLFYGQLDNKLTPFLQGAELGGVTSLKYFIKYHPDEESENKWNDQNHWKKIFSRKETPQFCVYENSYAVPAAYLATEYALTRNEEESLQGIKKHIDHLSDFVVIENGSPSFPSAEKAPQPASIQITRYGLNEVDMLVEASQPSIAVLAAAYYPGWNAYVDGEKKPVWRANSVFRAVEVPPGRHKVTFKYNPFSLLLGSIVSICGFIFTFGAMIAEKMLLRRK